MTIRERGSSWQVDVTALGTRFRENHGSEKAAERRELQILKSPQRALLARSRGSRSKEGQGIGAALEGQYKASWGVSRSAATFRSHIKVLNAHFGADMPLTAINRTAVDGFVSTCRNKGHKGSTITRRLSCLSKVLRVAYENGDTDRRISMPNLRQPEGRKSWYTPEEVVEIAKAFDDLGESDMADYVILMANTGLRMGEALELHDGMLKCHIGKVAPVHFLEVYSSKTGTSRRIPLNDVALSVVRHQFNMRGSPPFQLSFTYPRFVRVWAKVRTVLGKESDKEFVPYLLRHSFASNLKMKGADLSSISTLLGHTNLQQTARYAKVGQSELKNVVDLL